MRGAGFMIEPFFSILMEFGQFITIVSYSGRFLPGWRPPRPRTCLKQKKKE